MLVILEGADCSGKSTLASKLARAIEHNLPEHTVTILHKGPPELHPLDEYEVPLFSYRPNMGQHIICDRWHMGESVYPTILKRPTQLNDGTRLHIEMFLRARGAIVVHVAADDHVLEQCISRRGDDLIESGKGHELNTLYNVVAQTSIMEVIHVDGREITSATVQHIITRAITASTAAAKLNEFTTYIGAPAPRLLLVGDVRHNTYDGDIRPAFMPYSSTSGHYLLNALARHADRRWLSNIGIMNACDTDNVAQLHDIVSSTMTTAPALVSLGRKASKALPQADWHVPHPQFVRRFSHNTAAEYVNDIIGRSRSSYSSGFEGIGWN